MSKGKLIVFEGIDGCGKDTQLNLLASRLSSEYIPFVRHREPTNGHIGKLIREKYLSKDNVIDEYALRLLFSADCLDHITNSTGILSRLEDGFNILCSRYYHSNIAYGSLSFDMLDMIKLNEINMKRCPPYLTIFLDIDAFTAMSRIQKRNANLELYEEIDKLKRIREIYLDLAELLKENIIILDATSSKKKLADKIFEEVNKIGVIEQ